MSRRNSRNQREKGNDVSENNEVMEPYTPPADYIDQDYNGLWFVLNHDGFPISPAFKHREEAVAWKNQLI